MAFHTLAEFVATVLITLIASGGVFGGMFAYYKLRTKEIEAEDARDAEALLGAMEAHLRTVETRLDAMESAVGALLDGLGQPPAPQSLDAPATAGTADKVLPRGGSDRGRSAIATAR